MGAPPPKRGVDPKRILASALAMDKQGEAERATILAQAKELRQLARVAELPGYAERFIAAAEALEKYAEELDTRD